MAINDPIQDTRRAHPERPVTVNATEARQGSTGRPIFYVLVIGLVLALLAWAASEMFGTAIEPENTVNSTTQAPAAEPATENEAITNDNAPAGATQQTAPAEIESTTQNPGTNTAPANSTNTGPVGTDTTAPAGTDTTAPAGTDTTAPAAQ